MKNIFNALSRHFVRQYQDGYDHADTKSIVPAISLAAWGAGTALFGAFAVGVAYGGDWQQMTSDDWLVAAGLGSIVGVEAKAILTAISVYPVDRVHNLPILRNLALGAGAMAVMAGYNSLVTSEFIAAPKAPDISFAGFMAAALVASAFSTLPQLAGMAHRGLDKVTGLTNQLLKPS